MDKLISDELRSIENNVSVGLREQILKALDERGRAQDLIRQQYTGRYPFELLQNANDAAADANGGSVAFVITDNSLIVADQGTGFGAKQIQAICRLGRSSKDPRKSIGYKGLGFKSVGEITDTPQILSESVAFGFDATRTRLAVESIVGELDPTQKLPVYAFPFSLTPSELGADFELVERLRNRGFRTVLRLPFRPDVSRLVVEEHIRATINSRLLLFLDATDALEVTGTEADFRATVARSRSDWVTETLLETNGEIEHWLVFQRRLENLDRALVDPVGDAWKLVDTVHVAAGVLLDAQNLPCRGKSEFLHVYFPTEEATGLSLVLHGDFALELDRRHLGRSPETLPYNDWLARELAGLVRDVAEHLAERFPNHSGVVASLSPIEAGSGFGDLLAKYCLDRLRDAKFVPTVSGAVSRPCDSALLPASLTDPGLAEKHLDLAAIRNVAHPAVQADPLSRTMLARLDADELTTDEALAVLREPGPASEAEFYEFLVDWADHAGRYFPAKLSTVACVRTVGGGWVAPNSNVFFPRQRDTVQFPEGLQVPIVAVPDVDGLRPILERAGVRPFEWRQLIPDFVLPLLTEEYVEEGTRAIAFAALQTYYEQERTGDPRIRAQIAQVLLPTRSTTDFAKHMAPAGTLYFSSRWLGHDRLERIYGAFGKAEFLAMDPPETQEERQNQFAFLSWIGVAEHPRIDERRAEQREIYSLENLNRHPHSAYEALWLDWFNAEITGPNRACEQGHTSSQHLRASYALDRFPALVESGSPERLGLLWRELCNHWGNYERSMHADIQCQHGWHTGGNTMRQVPSLLHYMLRALKWVPSIRDKSAALEIPSRVWRVTSDTPRQIVERITALDLSLDVRGSAPLVAFLGVVDAARPAPESLVDLLRDLASAFEAQGESKDERGLILAARWAMRTLNDVLQGQTLEGPVPLLARQDGRRVFTQHPFVATDRLLAETWEPVFPILDADLDLRRLHTALRLRNLDDEVQTKPDPREIRLDRREEIEKHIALAKPYLAVVAIEQVPSRHADVLRGLARLEIVVCDRLVLRYELDEQVREHDDAVAYIAARVEQEGSTRRRTGTAHLELDTKTQQPHWYAFGPQLAQFLNVPGQGDAFSLLLAGSKEDREQYLAARRIPLTALEEARLELAQAPSEEIIEDLLRPDTVAGGTQDEVPPAPSVSPQPTKAMPSPTEARTTPLPEPALPPLEHDRITVEDAAPATSSAPPGPAAPGGNRRPGLGPQGTVDHEQQARIDRKIGHRGEEAVFEAEKRRLKSLSRDPGLVVWASKSHPYAPYDIQSLDDEGHIIYIEVKSTTSNDPYDAFEISEAELLFATQKRTNYYVYRVTEAHTANPVITRFHDPIRRLHEKTAQLRLSGARLKFHST